MKLDLMMGTAAIRTKIVVLISGLILIVAAVLALFSLSQMQRLSEEGLEARAHNTVTVLARAVRDGLLFEDREFINDVLSTLDSSEDVRYALLRRSSDGKILGAYNRKVAPKAVDDMVPGPQPKSVEQYNLLHAYVETVAGDPDSGDVKRAVLSIGFSLAPVQAEARSNLALALAASLIVFLVGLGASFLIGTALTRQIGDTSVQIASAAAQIHAAAQQQEAAGTEQSAAIEEVSHTLQSLLESAAHIAESTQGVLTNAERARETSDLTATKITELTGHTNRIAEILNTIREIADRSDLLALNASLEATRAGRAGRSFALVAAEMRRLAERVTASVEDVKSLVADVRASGSSTVVATEESLKLVQNTTESARQISMVTEQQRSATEQVSESMRDFSRVIAESVAAIQQMRGIAETLKVEADRMALIVGETNKGAASARHLDSSHEKAA